MFVSLIKEMNLINLPKYLLKKALFVLLLTSTSIAQALTLGEFAVDSFLDKPLKAEIYVNGDSGDNLKTLEVSMASAEEFEQAGIVRSSSLDDFQFDLVTESKKKAKIKITTETPVSDPYIHMLLKIRWNGGQLLREFTALIDPPLYSSQPADTVDVVKTTKQKEAELREELKSVDENDSTQTQENVAEPVSPAAPQPETAGSLVGDTYGPVVAGESLSEVAQKIQRENPDLSIYQIMYVLFQNNQSAFVEKNINSLAKGATLQVGDLNEITKVDKQEGINFFYSQLAQWSAKQESLTGASAEEVKVSSDESTGGQASGEGSSSASNESAPVSSGGGDSATGESKPEFQVAASDVQSGTQESGEVNNKVIEGLRTKVAELEASVESSKLENEELKETISILENQLADSNRLIELNNQELASLQGADKAEAENEALVATTVEEEPKTEEPKAEEELVKEAEVEAPTETETEQQPIVEPKVEETPPAQVEQPKAEPVQVATPEATPAPVSFLDEIIAKVKEVWMFIAVLLAGILLLLMLKMRSSKKEEDTVDAFESTFTVYPEDTGEMTDDAESTSNAKAEELINAIKAETTKPASDFVANSSPVDNSEEKSSDETSMVSSIDMDALREATQSVTDFEVDTAESGEVTKESSFLTVYNDGDVVVNADEIDPIAEADVYIAYGREDQGEEVLVDGVKNFPDRNDIKVALLGLYVKSGKRAKFDDIYNDMIANGLENNIEEWQNVEALKKSMDEAVPVGDSAGTVDEAPSAVDLLTDGISEEPSNTDFIVNSDVNDLSEIDIKSETFDISEIDFSTDIGDAPVLSNDSTDQVVTDIDSISAEIDDEITIDIDTNTIQIDTEAVQVDADIVEVDALEIDSDTVQIDLDTVQIDDDIESITIQVEEASLTPEISETNAAAEEELDGIVNALDDVDFSAENSESSIGEIEQEISQIEFSDDMLTEESSIQIDLDNVSVDQTDAVDISAEISEISYDDEISLTDVMELNVSDIDLASIPDEQDLTPVKDMAATTLVNSLTDDVEYVDDDTVDAEITVDFTEVDEGEGLDGIDLDLGDDDDTQLPDGTNDPETQLDLAKVFLELDDTAGAVKILKDLVDSPEVGEEAKELLAKHS